MHAPPEDHDTFVTPIATMSHLHSHSHHHSHSMAPSAKRLPPQSRRTTERAGDSYKLPRYVLIAQYLSVILKKIGVSLATRERPRPFNDPPPPAPHSQSSTTPDPYVVAASAPRVSEARGIRATTTSTPLPPACTRHRRARRRRCSDARPGIRPVHLARSAARRCVLNHHHPTTLVPSPPPDSPPPLPLLRYTSTFGVYRLTRRLGHTRRQKAPHDDDPPGVRGEGPRARVYAPLVDVY